MTTRIEANKSPYSLHTRIYDKEGKEHFFKWIEVNDGHIVQGQEYIVTDNKWVDDKIWINPTQFDFFIKDKKNPKTLPDLHELQLQS